MSWKNTIKKDEPESKSWRDSITKDPEEVSEAESFVRGGVQGASFGTADELTGAGEAIFKAIAGHDKLVDIISNYKKYRDESRKNYDTAEKANPKTYLGGNVAGGIASTFVPGLGALNAAKGAKLATLAGKGALQGGIMGLGGSESDTVAGDVVNTAIGAGIGAALPVAGVGLTKGAGKVWQAAAPEGVKAVTNAAKEAVLHPVHTSQAAWRGAKTGATAADAEAIKLPVIHAIQNGFGAVKGAIKEVNASNFTKGEVSDIARQAIAAITTSADEGVSPLVSGAEKSKVGELSKKFLTVLRPGEAGSIGTMTDEEALLAAVLSDGDNPIKKWLATKSATLYPGQVSADDYLQILNMPSAGRVTARGFDNREAARTIKPLLSETEEVFKDARWARFNDLQDEARAGFKENYDDVVTSTSDVLSEIKLSLSDAEALKSIPGGVKALLGDVDNMIQNGVGLRSHGLTKAPVTTVGGDEIFNRLQKSRELLDSKINWANKNGETAAEKLLTGVRESIDDALKTSSKKVEGDALYRASKEIEDTFFKAGEFRSPGGQTDFDEGKIARLFNDTDAGNRFRDALQKVKGFASREDLSPEFRKKAEELVKQLEEKMGIAENKRALGAFRYKNGPSSPAIERLESVVGKNSVLKDAVNSPAGFINSADEFSKAVQDRIGISFNELGSDQKIQAVKVWTWLKKNPGAAPAEVERVWKRYFGK